MSDIAILITAIVSALGVMGSGVAWLWAKVEARFKAVEAKLEECERRENRQKDIAFVYLRVIDLLMEHIETRVRGNHPVLDKARALLDDLKERHGDKP
jgi:putative protein kinase ArgK-like GTPase of G3E family